MGTAGEQPAPPLVVVAEGWRTAYPEARAGILAMEGVANPERHPGLEARKEELQRELRARFGGMEPAALRGLAPFAAYHAYYRRFGQTYHVEHQVASIAVKGRPIPRRAALVEAMFMAELADGLLTAGHDLDALVLPLRLNAATGEERYVLLSGAEQATKPGDLLMADGEGLVSSVIHGPDARTRITPATRRVLFATYGVPGVAADALRRHLAAIEANVRVIAPDARVIASTVVGPGEP